MASSANTMPPVTRLSGVDSVDNVDTMDTMDQDARGILPCEFVLTTTRSGPHPAQASQFHSFPEEANGNVNASSRHDDTNTTSIFFDLAIVMAITGLSTIGVAYHGHAQQ